MLSESEAADNDARSLNSINSHDEALEVRPSPALSPFLVC
jgi:hypothetical protein